MTSIETEADRVTRCAQQRPKPSPCSTPLSNAGSSYRARPRGSSDEVRDLAADLLGITKFWHKRIVRSGINTLEPYRANPPVLRIEADDVVFFDFGPLLEDWEADLGRTYVLGDDPDKHRLAADLPIIWNAARDHFAATADITGEALFAHVQALVTSAGWRFGNRHAGHLIGEFPHENVRDDEIGCYITPGSDLPMRRRDPNGNRCHWILEIHLIDPTGTFGGFHEQLLDI